MNAPIVAKSGEFVDASKPVPPVAGCTGCLQGCGSCTMRLQAQGKAKDNRSPVAMMEEAARVHFAGVVALRAWVDQAEAAIGPMPPEARGALLSLFWKAQGK